MNIKLSNPKAIVGIKKVPMSSVSAPVMAEIGVAMLEGAAKYGRHNYRAVGVRSSVYYDSTMRHLMAWWEGEDVDADSGMSHVTKAITSLVVLRDAMIQGMCTDDRPPSSVEFYTALNAKAGAIIDKYADRDPRHYTIADTKAASEQCKPVEEGLNTGGNITNDATFIVGESSSEQCYSRDIPSWKDVKQDHFWMAQDDNGKWFSFPELPHINEYDEWYTEAGYELLDYKSESYEFWRDSLNCRPKQ